MMTASVGILGGIGPQATVDLMQRVIDLTPARDDCDHIRMIVDNDPSVPSRIAALIEKTGPSPAPHLQRMARGLIAQGADFLAMPCNTAHHYLDDIRAAAGPVPMLDMVALTADRLKALPEAPRRIGLLASTAVRIVGLYDRAFEARGMASVFPRRQDAVLDVIRRVKAGKMGAAEKAEIGSAIADLRDQGADAIAIACTEISALNPARDDDFSIIDALDVLAETIVIFAKQEKSFTGNTTDNDNKSANPSRSFPQGELA